MKKIASFVFLDLETTGIPVYEHNKTKITELSMIAVKSQHLADLNSTGTPRVQHKLTLCLNPLRFIHPESSSLTKLSNDLLENEPHFNLEVFQTIDSFIKLLEKPVCLVAYNGTRFDYPVLKNRLEHLSVSLPEDLFCLDAYNAFYCILENKSSESILPNQSGNMDVHLKSEIKEFNLNFMEREKLQQQFENLNPENALDLKSETHKIPTHTVKGNTFRQNPKKDFELQSDALDNVYNTMLESEPKKFHVEIINNTTPTQMKQVEYCSTPKKIPVKTKSGGRAKRRLPWSVGDKPKNSYKLEDVYARLLNHKVIDLHRAEADCLLMLECAVVLSEKFINWANQNKELFSDIEPMQLGVPL